MQLRRTARQRPLGAVPLEEGRVEFRVWAPNAGSVGLRVGGRLHRLADPGGDAHGGEAPASAGED